MEEVKIREIEVEEPGRMEALASAVFQFLTEVISKEGYWKSIEDLVEGVKLDFHFTDKNNMEILSFDCQLKISEMFDVH